MKANLFRSTPAPPAASDTCIVIRTISGSHEREVILTDESQKAPSDGPYIFCDLELACSQHFNELGSVKLIQGFSLFPLLAFHRLMLNAFKSVDVKDGLTVMSHSQYLLSCTHSPLS